MLKRKTNQNLSKNEEKDLWKKILKIIQNFSYKSKEEFTNKINQIISHKVDNLKEAQSQLDKFLKIFE